MQRQVTFHGPIKVIKFCNATFFQFSGGAFEYPFPVLPTKGEHDYNTCDACKLLQRSIVEDIKRHFKKFPNCCKLHKKLRDVKSRSKEGFDKKKFGNVPQLVADKIIFTQQHIVNNIKSEQFLEEITDYIDNVVESFGQMPNNFGPPLYLVYYLEKMIGLIEGRNDIDYDRKDLVVHYFKKLLNPPKLPPQDFEAFAKIYERWIDIFPFKISYFKDLKSRFENWVPMDLMQGEKRFNRYLGTEVSRQLSQSEFVEKLTTLTMQLLDSIDSTKLVEDGLIDNIDKHRLELASMHHRTKQKALFLGYNNGEHAYLTYLQKWLKNEETYFLTVKQLEIELPKLTGKKTNCDLTLNQKTPTTLHSFDDLFYDPENITMYLDALRKIDQPVISEKNTWLKRKGNITILVEWIEVLEEKGKIKSIKKHDLIPLLEKKFSGLSMSKDGSNFRKVSSSQKSYKSDFLKLIK
ncbi:hypothetical protein QNI19_19600 [Cytophagaceae bacterium DM2B3-1]|uniref:Uncharacterized protein n=1 Tax=Xanthocytophaga flava TaxID=3048013 RepID=A0ABT7CN31_9BACT|nr:hypothetical protein [Xanthocytophaga flavus]MDJ1495154.1 hypothetical protein [Xanthocytophaga flavus]